MPSAASGLVRDADSHRFSSVVSPLMTDGTCVFTPTPSRMIRYVGQLVTSSPRIRTRPLESAPRNCPVIDLKKVLLPAPFGPIRQRNSRSRNTKFTLLTAETPPKCTDRSRVSMAISFIVQLP
jgi:hypothetical protein